MLKLRIQNISHFFGDHHRVLVVALFASVLFFSIGAVIKEALPNIIWNAMRLIGGLIFIVAISLIKKRDLDGPILIRMSSFVLVCWVAVSILRGLSFDPDILKMAVADREFLLPYLLIFLLYVNIDYASIRDIARILFIGSLLYLLISFSMYSYVVSKHSFEFMEVLNKFFIYASGFLLLTVMFYKRRLKFFIYGLFFIAVYFAIIQARRNQIFTLGLFVLASFFLNIGFMKLSRTGKFLLGFIFIALFSALIFGLFVMYQETIFQNLMSRGLIDSRSFVEHDYWKDLKLGDFIFGKGLDGKYYCPSLYGIDTDGKGLRKGIETGYLSYILKIGIIGFGLLLFVVLYAAFIGFFKSNNHFVKGAAVFLLIFVLELYPAANPLFTMRLALIFISVRICLDKKFRSVGNEVFLGKNFKESLFPNFKILT